MAAFYTWLDFTLTYKVLFTISFDGYDLSRVFFHAVTHKASGGSPRAAACNLIGFNFCLSAARRSLYSKAIQEGHDLRSGAICVGAECGVGGPLGDVLLGRPQNRISIVGGGLHIGKGIGRTRCRGLLGTPQERDDLGAGAGHVGAERGVAGALGDAILHRPQHSVVIIAAHRDVGEGHGVGFGFGTASCSPQEGHGLRSGAGSVRAEGRCGGAFSDAVVNSPLNGISVTDCLQPSKLKVCIKFQSTTSTRQSLLLQPIYLSNRNTDFLTVCVKFPEIPVYYLTVRNTDYSEDTPVNLSMIGPRIQQERKARGMTQSVLAEKVAVSTKYISNIECGEKLPRLETFIAIANALKTDANSLLVDVLDVSALIEASSVAEKISALPTAEQRRITHLLSVMVDDVIADYQ